MSYAWVGGPSPYNNFTDGNYGGDSADINVNQWFQSGDQAYIIVASAMVLLMVPGLGFLYSGLARRKSALSMIWVCLVSCAVMNFQWYFWGYSLAFSNSGTSGFIGDLHHFALQNTLAYASPGSPLIPELLYSFYQLQFACVTAAIVVGAVAERGRFVPAMVFTFFWATLVYCPIACWAWNVNGWFFKWGGLDYAGGGPVEIGSGASALAYSLVLGRRQEKMLLNFRPHNVSLITLGTILLWFGWLGFNGGSAFGANLRAVMACWNSNLAAMFGGVTWMCLDYRGTRKWTMVGFCSGVISGLVAATPASGYINPHSSILLGVVAGAVCNWATKIKYLLRIDDALDVFAEHAVGGMVGLIFNGLFGADYIIGLDGVNTGKITGGWPNHNWKQLYIQFTYVCAATGYAFVVSLLIAFLINITPGLHLRASEEAELLGMDEDQLGEFAYDYVEVRRDYLAWTPPKDNHDENLDEKGEPTVEPHDRHGIPQHATMLDGHSAKSEGLEEHPIAAGDRHGMPHEEPGEMNGSAEKRD